MATRLRRWSKRHLSAADEHFGLRLGAGLVITPVAAVVFALLVLLVRAGWAPLRDLDAGTAETFNRIDAAHPELVKAAEVVSDVFDPNVFRVALTLIALAYLIHGEKAPRGLASRHGLRWRCARLRAEGDRRPGPPGAAGSGLDGARDVIPVRPCAWGVNRLLPAPADRSPLPAARRPRRRRHRGRLDRRHPSRSRGSCSASISSVMSWPGSCSASAGWP